MLEIRKLRKSFGELLAVKLQRLTVVVPARWAVDGLDAMTWRGLGLGAAVLPTLVRCGFALLFAVLAVVRFRWEEG